MSTELVNPFQLNHLCDVTISFDSGESFHSHKLILSSYSDYFKYLFMFAKPSDTIILPDLISPSVFNLILKWFYTQKIKINSIKEAIDIIQACDFLSLNSLIRETNQYIIKHLSTGNCIDIFIQMASFMMKRIPIGENYRNIFNAILSHKNSEIDLLEPIEVSFFKSFYFIRDNLNEILKLNPIANFKQIVDYLGTERMLIMCQLSLNKMTSYEELKALYVFITAVLNESIYELYNPFQEDAFIECCMKDKEAPTVTFKCKDYNEKSVNSVYIRKVIKASNIIWNIVLRHSYSSHLELEINNHSEQSSFIEVCSLMYFIRITYDTNEIIQSGTLSMNLNEKNSACIKLMSNVSIKDNVDISIEVTLNEIPIFNGLIQYMSYNFKELFIKGINDKDTSKEILKMPVKYIFNVLKSSTMNIDSEGDLLQFIFDYFRLREKKKEKHIVNLLSTVSVRVISIEDLLQVYKDDYLSENSLCKRYEKVNNFFRNEIKRRCQAVKKNKDGFIQESDCMEDALDYIDSNDVIYYQLLNCKNKTRSCFKKQIEEEFECDKKKGFVTEIKNFLFKHGVDIDLNGELINVNYLFTKNEIAVNSLRNFAKELQDCCKVISNEQKSPLVPPSRVLESKNKLHEELKEKFSHEDEYVQRKIEDIIKEINTLREVLLE